MKTKMKMTKEWARIYKAQCNEEIYMTKYNFAKAVRAVVPGAPDNVLEGLAIYDPEARRVIRYFERKRRYYERLLRHPQ
ncbi:MAG: hypothetical protein WCI95_08020 [bacterium]